LDERIKIIFSGRINEPIVAEEILQAGICDLVGMTRAGIADPEFVNKIREGRLSEMRRCIGCNRCIAEVVHGSKPLGIKGPVCSINPVIGNELLWEQKFKPAAVKKRVVVVGAGPAGLEAARVAAMRGHSVVLLEKAKRVGGQMLLASKAPGRDSFEDFIYFQENEIDRLGIELRLQTTADAAMIHALGAEVLVCASGSVARMPLEAEGLDGGHVVTGWDVLANRAQLGERVVVYSEEDYFETPNVAEAIAATGKQVTIVHKWAQVGSEIDRYSFGAVMKRLEEHNIRLVGGQRLKAVKGREIECISAYSGKSSRQGDFDSVVLVCGSVPNDRLYYELKNDPRFERTFLIGAAWTPRRIAEATRHGAMIALEI
jgi:NADPH-dependent 2,4-dienoyl-CoA reductase/sulfur reductase-like enzyme